MNLNFKLLHDHLSVSWFEWPCGETYFIGAWTSHSFFAWQIYSRYCSLFAQLLKKTMDGKWHFMYFFPIIQNFLVFDRYDNLFLCFRLFLVPVVVIVIEIYIHPKTIFRGNVIYALVKVHVIFVLMALMVKNHFFRLRQPSYVSTIPLQIVWLILNFEECAREKFIFIFDIQMLEAIGFVDLFLFRNGMV